MCNNRIKRKINEDSTCIRKTYKKMNSNFNKKKKGIYSKCNAEWKMRLVFTWLALKKSLVIKKSNVM